MENIHSQNVLDYPNKNTIFMVWTFNPDSSPRESFNSICKLVINLNHSAATRFPAFKASVVMGISYQAWRALTLPQPLPRQLTDFQPIIGARHTAVATEGDLHFHIRSEEYSFCIDAAKEITRILGTSARCTEEIHGFKYWDSRSILGFVDGTENPHGPDRSKFGIIGEEDPSYKGCSYLFTQKYLHHIKAWEELPVSEQERVIGRYKISDVEMPDDIKPSNAHSALANIGDDLKIVRDNMPFGNIATNDMGTYFIAYASSFNTILKMLHRMFVGEPEGNYDRILDFSTAHTGTLYFVPTYELLDELSG